MRREKARIVKYLELSMHIGLSRPAYSLWVCFLHTPRPPLWFYLYVHLIYNTKNA